MDINLSTKMKIHKPATEVFESIVDPLKIGNFWFSSSSERWAQGKTITLNYDEYGAKGDIHVLEVQDHKKIVFTWGEPNGETVVTISLKELDHKHNSSIIEVTESGFKENDPDLVNKLVGQKEGWVYMLSCLKAYLEHEVKNLRGSLIH